MEDSPRDWYLFCLTKSTIRTSIIWMPGGLSKRKKVVEATMQVEATMAWYNWGQDFQLMTTPLRKRKKVNQTFGILAFWNAAQGTGICLI